MEKIKVCSQARIVMRVLVLCVAVCVMWPERTANSQGISQKNRPGVYLSYQPADHGLGLRSDIGMFYLSLTYGNWGVYRLYNLQHHFKMTAGLKIPLPDFEGFRYYPTAGINYHFTRQKGADETLVYTYGYGPRTLSPLSFELGLTMSKEWFTLGVRTDILRWEPCVDVGVLF